MILVPNKEAHLDDGNVISDDDEEEAGQHGKGAGQDDQLAEEEAKLELAGEELYEEEELDHEIEAKDLELDKEASLEEEKTTAQSSNSM